MEVMPADLVVEVEGLLVAMVVVVEDPSLEMEGRVAAEEAGVLVPKARFRTLARDVEIGVAMVMPM